MLIEAAVNLQPDQSASISAWATVVVAFFSIVTVAVSFLVVRENRLLRKAGNKPEIIPYLAPHPDGHGGVNFVLANVGTGPAMEVKFRFDYDEADFRGHDAHLYNDNVRQPFTLIKQGETREMLFGVGYILYGNSDVKQPPLKPFGVAVSYKNLTGKRIIEKLTNIDIRQFHGLAGITTKPPQREIADALMRISSALERMARQPSPKIGFVDATSMRDGHRRKLKGEPTTSAEP
jgi:hypothetical protein